MPNPILSSITIPVKRGNTFSNETFDLPSGGGGGGASSPESIGIGYGTCSTASNVSAKVAALNGYRLVKNGIVSIKFDKAVNAGATLNINDKGDKPIYYRGNAIVNNIIKAGDIATFIYDGTNYNVLTLDNLWKAYVDIIGDPNDTIRVRNQTYGVDVEIELDNKGYGQFMAKLPGTYVFSVGED